MIFRQVTDSHHIDKLRKLYKSSYFNRLYSGWSDQFDKIYDKNSTWFVLENKDSKSTYALCRVIFASRGQLPIETQLKDLRLKYGENICEINNFIYKNKKHAKIFMSQVFSHIQRSGNNTALCIVDIKNEVALNMDKFDFHFEETDEYLMFDDVCDIDTKSCVKWRLLTQSIDARNKAIESLNSNAIADAVV